MHKTQVILVTGKKQSGKSTACEFMKTQLSKPNQTHDVRIYSFATALKDFCVDVLGVPYDQVWGTDEQKNLQTHINWYGMPFSNSRINELRKQMGATTRDYLTGRELLQLFGSDICRKMYGDCWVFNTIKRIHSENPQYALICDARFPNELEFFRLSADNQFVDRLESEPVVVRLLRNPFNSQHISETALDGYDFGKFTRYYEIDNTNIDESRKNMLISQKLIPSLLNNTLRLSLPSKAIVEDLVWDSKVDGDLS